MTTPIYDATVKSQAKGAEIVIVVPQGDYITCSYPITAFQNCCMIICIDNMDSYPTRCPRCGRGI
jgi:hypothetical protein